MEFYVGWSHSDAVYCNYFKNCPMLISAVPDNKHAFKKFNNSPSKLIIDSGAFTYAKRKQHIKLKDIFELQRYLLESTSENVPTTLVHLDEPLFNKESLSENYQAIEKTIYNAFEHMKLFGNARFPPNVKLMGVIQGYDYASIHYSVHELKKLGYKLFGIGSLLKKSAKSQIKYINYAANLVGAENLHVFGVTGIEQIREMAKLDVLSFDSTRPTMTSVYHQIFYSNPFRTYLISGSNVQKTQEKIEKPLFCECPVCIEDAEKMFNLTHRKYTKLRSIHNYHHFSRTIDNIKEERGLV